jgi:dihydroxy-acid dehydratase
VQEGDIISIDIPNHRLDLLVPDDVLSRRRRDMVIKQHKNLSGYLERYARYVSSADKGAVVK